MTGELDIEIRVWKAVDSKREAESIAMQLREFLIENDLDKGGDIRLLFIRGGNSTPI